jgi:hypothetical protein
MVNIALFGPIYLLTKFPPRAEDGGVLACFNALTAADADVKTEITGS